MKLFEFLTKYSDLELRSQKWAKARSIGPKKPRDQGLSADSTQFFFLLVSPETNPDYING
jgi:hypothetical protein